MAKISLWRTDPFLSVLEQVLIIAVQNLDTVALVQTIVIVPSVLITAGDREKEMYLFL